MNIPSYNLYPFPMQMPKNMTYSQAKAYFEFFKELISSRIEELNKLLQNELNISSKLDYSQSSLNEIGKILNHFASYRLLSIEEIQRDLESAPERMIPFLSKDTLTTETFSLCMDGSIYFAEVLRRKKTQLKWSIQRKKKTIDLHQPVLGPFKDGTMCPFLLFINIAGTVAVQKGNAVDEIQRFFDCWENEVE